MEGSRPIRVLSSPSLKGGVFCKGFSRLAIIGLKAGKNCVGSTWSSGVAAFSELTWSGLAYELVTFGRGKSYEVVFDFFDESTESP